MSTPERRAALTWFSHGYYNACRSNRVGWAKEPALAPATCPRVGTARKSAPLPTLRMLVHTPGEIVGDADVKRPVFSAGENVYVVLSCHPEDCGYGFRLSLASLAWPE